MKRVVTLALLIFVPALAPQGVRNSNGAAVYLTDGAGNIVPVGHSTTLEVTDGGSSQSSTYQALRVDGWGDGTSTSYAAALAAAQLSAFNGASFDRLRTTKADSGNRTGVLEVDQAETYAYINVAATTSVKGAAGLLHKITVNTAAAGTIGLYDVAAAGCTGTPASGKFGVITLTASTAPVTLTYDVKTANGICLVTSAAMDLTVAVD